MIAPLPYLAALPILRAYGVPADPPVPGIGLRHKARALLERRGPSRQATAEWPPPAPAHPRSVIRVA